MYDKNKWNKNRPKSIYRSYPWDFHFAMDILTEIYYSGFINWNIYQKAMEKVKRNMKGSWMFEKGNLEIDFSKPWE